MINKLNKQEKISMVKQRMVNYQRKYYELYLDLIAQQSIQGEEQYISATQERLQALETSYNAMKQELENLEKEGE